LALLCIANFLGKKFFMRIKGLHEYDCGVTGGIARIASIGAAVGILARVKPGPARG
jgi:hypothetical protein